MRRAIIPNAAREFNSDLGETADAIRATVRDFAAERIAPRADEIDRTNTFPRDLWPEMGALEEWGTFVTTACDPRDHRRLASFGVCSRT
jgi:alkylation response protein AidB-like acyl-CoA dehydrogenase